MTNAAVNNATDRNNNEAQMPLWRQEANVDIEAAVKEEVQQYEAAGYRKLSSQALLAISIVVICALYFLTSGH